MNRPPDPWYPYDEPPPETEPSTMAVEHGTAQQAYDKGRRHGIILGLQMANKYASMCKTVDEVAAMIRAAAMTVNLER